MDNIETFAAFARRLGCKPAYVTALRKADRLVLTDDGRRVRVAESIARIEATRDPAKAAVAARHAAARAQAAGEGQRAADAPHAPAEADESDAHPVIVNALLEAASDIDEESFQYWRRRSEKAKALAAERENALAERKLLDAAEAASAISAAVTTLRARLESLPDTLAPQLAAETDEARIRAVMAETIEHALEETSRQFFNLTRAEQAHA